MGEEVVEQALRGLPLVHDYEVNTFVRTLAQRLVDQLGTQPFEYDFFVVRDDSINAFAVPGGKVFIHAGLISRALNQAEVAGVLGHEIAHTHAHHAFRQQERGRLANYASLLGIFLGAINPVLAQAALAAAMTQQLSYQREFEREADFLGVGYAEKAGFEPGAMLGMLRKIHGEQQLNPTSVPPYFLSHPLTTERLANLESALKKNEWTVEKTPPTPAFERVQTIVRAYSQTRREVVPDFERRLRNADASERPKAVEHFGLLMAHGEEYASAIGHLLEAQSLGRQVDRELGRAYLRSGEFAKAKPLLTAAVAREPKDWNAQSDLGELHYQRGDYDLAVAALAKAVELYPYLPATQRIYGRALNKAGRTGAAFYHYAEAAEFEGQMRSALDYYVRAREQLPADDPLRAGLAERIENLEELFSGHPQAPTAQRPGS